MMYLSRAILRRDAGLAALAPVLLPNDADLRAAMAHRIVWALFGDDGGRRRDYLWREEGPGCFLVLSPEPPANTALLFELETKEFAPALDPGDRLSFMLRTNATVARRNPGGKRGQPADIVSRALAGLPEAERAGRRETVAQQAALDWLSARGASAGFRVGEDLRVMQDEWRRIARAPNPPDADNPRARDAKPFATFGVLDLTGTLEVTDPATFLAALFRGFGRAKAFGCGLMLIRRARS